MEILQNVSCQDHSGRERALAAVAWNGEKSYFSIFSLTPTLPAFKSCLKLKMSGTPPLLMQWPYCFYLILMHPSIKLLVLKQCK